MTYIYNESMESKQLMKLNAFYIDNYRNKSASVSLFRKILYKIKGSL